MEYLVEIDHGKVVSKGPHPLPAKATGVLTIPQPGSDHAANVSFLPALESLQRHLSLSETEAQKWMQSVRDARR